MERAAASALLAQAIRAPPGTWIQSQWTRTWFVIRAVCAAALCRRLRSLLHLDHDERYFPNRFRKKLWRGKCRWSHGVGVTGFIKVPRTSFFKGCRGGRGKVFKQCSRQLWLRHWQERPPPSSPRRCCFSKKYVYHRCHRLATSSRRLRSPRLIPSSLSQACAADRRTE